MIHNSYINIRQTRKYANFMRSINWQVEEIDGVFVYIKSIPIYGSVIKIQRPSKLPNFNKLKHLANKYKARQVSLEPLSTYNLQPTTYNHLNDPYIHTKTIYIDLTVSEKTIFNQFTSAKRRAVRRAKKLGVQTEISDNIEDFVRLKNKTSGLFLGFLTTRSATKPMWNAFYPDHAKVILAYKVPESHRQYGNMAVKQSNCLAGILLFYINGAAYYWMAAATKKGKKLFAPTLLVWEALKFAKSKNCRVFDFEGVLDERFPKRSPDWQGFSKFKLGFGGKEVYYPQPINLKL